MTKIKNQIKNSSQAAFTLIEMVVVVFVVGIGLIGALSFYNINISNQLEVKNELIAAGLAQECTDLVRNMRDFNLRNNRQWDQGFGPSSACRAIDYNSLSALNHQCISSNTTAVCLNSEGRYYQYQCSAGTSGATVFERTMTASSQADGSIKIDCVVSWNGRLTRAVDYLYKNSL